MKVNITGKGKIPGVGALAPIYGKDLSEKEIRRLLNFSSFRLFDYETGLLITKKNISKMLDNKPTEIPIINDTEHVEISSVIEETVEDVSYDELPEIIADEVVEESVCDVTGDVINDVVDETESNTDEIVSVDEISTNTSENNNRNNNYNRNKNKKKHK